jgi:hypothetical protein
LVLLFIFNRACFGFSAFHFDLRQRREFMFHAGFELLRYDLHSALSFCVIFLIGRQGCWLNGLMIWEEKELQLRVRQLSHESIRVEGEFL